MVNLSWTTKMLDRMFFSRSCRTFASSSTKIRTCMQCEVYWELSSWANRALCHLQRHLVKSFPNSSKLWLRTLRSAQTTLTFCLRLQLSVWLSRSTLQKLSNWSKTSWPRVSTWLSSKDRVSTSAMPSNYMPLSSHLPSRWSQIMTCFALQCSTQAPLIPTGARKWSSSYLL